MFHMKHLMQKQCKRREVCFVYRLYEMYVKLSDKILFFYFVVITPTIDIKRLYLITFDIVSHETL